MLSQLTVCSHCYIIDSQFLSARRCVRILALCLFVSPCLSVASRSSVERLNESSWFFLRGVFLTSFALCGKEIHIFTKIRVLSSETLAQAPYLENFVTACWLLKRVINLARERWTLTIVINWTVVCQLSYNTFKLRRSTSLVYRTDRQAVFVARFRRVGWLVTSYITTSVAIACI